MKKFTGLFVLIISILVFVSTTQCVHAEKISKVQEITFDIPSDSAIASDGSFFVVTGAQADGSVVLYKTIVNFSENDFATNTTSINLGFQADSNDDLEVALSNDNKKALVFYKSQSSLIELKIINLIDSSVKSLKSILNAGLIIKSPKFLDSEGKKLIAATEGTENPRLIAIDTETDTIEELVNLADAVQSLGVSPSFKKAVITYRDSLAQSVSIYNIEGMSLKTIETDPSIAFSVDDFLEHIRFDILGKKAVLSTIGGDHNTQFLDLENEQLKFVLLDNSLDGLSFSTLSPDGMTIITTGEVFDIFSGFQLYESSILSNNAISVVQSKSFTDNSIVLDLAITPDQSKIFILVEKDDQKRLKVIDRNSFSEITELLISTEVDSQSDFLVEPNGRYAFTANTGTDPSALIVTDLNLGPILKNIVPDVALINFSSPFKINGFLDPNKFSGTISVCFQNNKSCATDIRVTDKGTVITGNTPKVEKGGIKDVIINAELKSGSSTSSSKYNSIFEFVKQGGKTIADTFLPEVTISAPSDSTIFNTKRILVIGKADGTGSEITSVKVNGIPAKIITEGQSSSTIVTFISDLGFEIDGTFEISITAEDKSQNIIEKKIKIVIDTTLPKLNATIDETGNVTGTADGTGSKISTILVNSTPINFEKGNVINFNATATTPVIITAIDEAGNKNTLEISGTQNIDKAPPVIIINSVSNGQIFKEPSVNISFTVTDDNNVKEVLFNGTPITVSPNNQYTQTITLIPGRNSIIITATDENNNKSSAQISVTFIASEISTTKPTDKIPKEDLLNEKEVLTLPPDVEDLNETLIEQYSDIIQNGMLLDISSTVSLEISNPPPIPEGEPAKIDVPKVSSEIIEEPEEKTNIPIGFSIASSVKFTDSSKEIKDEETDKQNTVVLVDNAGRTFVTGFAFLKRSTNEMVPLDLTSTITIPSDASEGDARISILRQNSALATVPVTITPSKDVKIKAKKKGKSRKVSVQKPQLDRIVAKVKKSGTELSLMIVGRNFIKSLAIIDGQLERIIGKGSFLTNVTFVPSVGINIKKLRVVSSKKIILTAEITDDIDTGIKLFNVITPKGVDIGAVTIPETITDGTLETSINPESLILETD